MQPGTVTVSAPGKAILHGEHAVVHGKAALAVSLNLRTYLRLQVISSDEVSLSLPNIQTSRRWDTKTLKLLQTRRAVDESAGDELDAELMEMVREFAGVAESSSDASSLAVLSFLYIYLCVFSHSQLLPGVQVCVWSELPTGAGLGSSAAYCVSLSAALLHARGSISPSLTHTQDTARWSEEELKLINKWAFQGEKIIHGNPSGVDNAVGTWGGFLRYQGGKITPMSRVPSLRILLTNTGVPRSTKLLVSRVKDNVTKYPSVMVPVLESVDAVSRLCEGTLAEMAAGGAAARHYGTLEDLLDINQQQLNLLGVGHPALTSLCQLTLARGLHSKLTGAGGGGCAITLLPPETEESVVREVMEELRRLGFECWETSIGAPGVLLHSAGSLPQSVQHAFSKY